MTNREVSGYSRRRLSFPEVGRIRKGSKKRTRKRKDKSEYQIMGKDLTYFRVDFDETDPFHEKTLNDFLTAYGPQPASLNILLPFNTVEDNFGASREAHLAGGMIFKGEFFPNERGEYRVLYRVESESGVAVRDGIPYDTYDPYEPVGYYGNDNKPIMASPTGRLRVLVRELNRLAFLTALTGSVNDIYFLDEQLGAIEMFASSLRHVPILFRRKPFMISYPDEDGNRKRVEKWLLQCEPDPRWVEQRLLAADVEMYALPAPVSGDDVVDVEIPEHVPPEFDVDTTEEIIDEEIVEGEATELTSENGVDTDDPVNLFWLMVHEHTSLSTTDAENILKECDGSYENASNAVRKKHVPPDDKWHLK